MKKFTRIEEDLIVENLEVAKKYGEHNANALQKLDKIKIALDNMAIDQQKDPSSWGFVGSLVHINEELDDILDFLGVYDEKIALTEKMKI